MGLHDVIGRAINRGLAIVGEPSSLDGQPCGSVHLARNVDLVPGIMDRADDNHGARADVATIASQYEPRSGMVLVHPTEGTFKLTKRLRDNGFSRRYIVVQLP